MIANATGCSSIWGGSAPSTPYTKDANGRGPAWANSLFEDNAEFGLGMHLGVKAIRTRLADNAKKAIEAGISDNAKVVLEDWIANMDNGDGTVAKADNVIAALQGENNEFAKAILNDKDYLAKRSQWIFGGDGWAYDIGYGGL